jgi:hypothetical protein
MAAEEATTATVALVAVVVADLVIETEIIEIADLITIVIEETTEITTAIETAIGIMTEEDHLIQSVVEVRVHPLRQEIEAGTGSSRKRGTGE